VTTNLLVDTTDVELSHVDAGEVGVQSIDINIGGPADGVDDIVTASTLTVDDVEDISISSSGDSDSNAITNFEANNLRNLTFTGEVDLAVDGLTDTIQDEVDASEFTGDLTLDLAGGGGVQTNAIALTVGSGGSTLSIDVDDENAHAITLGDGADTIDLAKELGNTYVDATASMMSITGFEGGEGNDVLDFAVGTAVATDSELEDIQTAVDDALEADSGLTLIEALDAALGAYTQAAKDVFWFEFDVSTFVAAVNDDDNDNDGNSDTFDEKEDFVIELTGTDLGITADNITVV